MAFVGTRPDGAVEFSSPGHAAGPLDALLVSEAWPGDVALRRRVPGRTGTTERRPTGPRLRIVGLGDLPTLTRQRLAMLDEMKELGRGQIRRYGPVFSRWFRREYRSGRIFGILAETAEGEPLAGGLLWLQPRPPSARFPQRETPYIFSVYTEPLARRRGLGRRVVIALIDWATRRGYTRLELHSTDAGRHLYAALGFRATTQMRFETRHARSATYRGTRVHR